jgi:hypothetical protein
MRMRPILFSCVLLASCWGSKGVTPPTQPEIDGVKVEIASALLAEDCGGSASASAGAPAESAKASSADVAGDVACEQTTVVMKLTSKGQSPTKIQIKKIELLDAKHHVIGELAAREPSTWNDSAYTPWDETLAPGGSVQASYKLGAPDWSKIGGRGNATGKTFHLRVTLTVGDKERTVEKQASIPTVPEMPDGVVT